MVFKRTALSSGICALAMTSAMAELPQRAKPVGDQSWPIVLKEAKRNPSERLWSKAEIDQAQARCMVLLKDIEFEADYEAPMRQGNDCGSPAPMRLMSIGSPANRVVFSPPPTVTCEMIAGLASWLQQDVQKLARKHLGTPVTRIETMSSYSCRNAYGRSDARLSEHGRANALDIASFVADRAHLVNVEADWGMTQREIAERQNETNPQPVSTAIVPVGPPPALVAVPTQPSAPSVGFANAPAGLQETRPNVPGIMLQFMGRPASGDSLGFSRLGGPKVKPAPESPQPVSAQAASRAGFLRALHKTACRTFGTVLGPEANTTHRNHFHLDMAERAQQTKICE
jgi:hypothetical protein